MKISIKNLNKTYGKEIVLNNFNLELYDDKVNAIIGKSGCGKTTLLNIIADLMSYESGQIEGISKSDISYVFQEDRLIEYLTVEENLKLALKKYYDKNIIKAKIDEILKLVNIEDTKNKYPNELSGGMRQRVNIARAFGKTSKIILMDEPFKSLDYKIKYTIINELKNVLEKEKRMIILVTHDLDEAIYFNGRIIVLKGNPVEVYKIFENNLEYHKEEILRLI